MTDKKQDKAVAKLQERIEALESELEESQEITKRAQSDYFRLKMDMDAYIERAQQNQQQAKTDALISIAQKLLPAVNQLEQSVNNTPTELAEHKWTEGVQLSYNKAISELATIGILPIETEVGQEPDLMLHLPISTQPTDKPEHKGKIVSVVERGYIYTKNEQSQVISPSKVIVGQ